MCAIAKQLEIESWNWLDFNGHSLRTFCEIFGPRSGQIRTLAQVSWPSFKKVRNHAVATVNVGSVRNLQDYLVISVPIKCMPKNFYPDDLRSGQFRDLTIRSLWWNMKMLPVSHKPIKTTQWFQDHGHSPLLCRSGCDWWSGATGRSPEVKWRHNHFSRINRDRMEIETRKLYHWPWPDLYLIWGQIFNSTF